MSAHPGAARHGRHRRRPRRLRAADHAVPIALGGTVAAAALVAPLATHLRVDARPGTSALGVGSPERPPTDDPGGDQRGSVAVVPVDHSSGTPQPGPTSTAAQSPAAQSSGSRALTEAHSADQATEPAARSTTPPGKHRKDTPVPSSEPTSSPEETDDGPPLPLPTTVPTSLPLPSLTVSLPVEP